uniref:hypothetical protein n=1 Tax=Paractinoplanes polyasparticus TaxID=2856853 RepID=UPI001C866DA1|nr:hypothetical protein [Actinoplanes polyasparticus]
MPIPARVVVFGIGVLLAGTGIALSIEADSAYNVNIAESGDGCDRDGINIDSSTGLSLACVSWREDADPGPRSPFTEQEKQRVYALAKELGGDVAGLTADDEGRVESLVDEIAAANGDPDESDDAAGSPGHIAFLIGMPLAIGGGIFVLSRGFRDPEF